MTANTSKLKAWRDAVSAGENCLSLDALERLTDGASSDRKSAQHLAGCPHCQAELAMLRSFESLPAESDRKPVEWVAARLQGVEDVPSTPVRVPLWGNLLRIQNLAGAAALTLVIGLGVSLYVSNRQGRPVLRGEFSEIQNMRSGDLRLTEPSGDLNLTPEAFRWDRLPLATSYSIQLLEVDGTVLWSGQSGENFITVGPELKSKIQPGKELLWKVTALDGSGNPIATSSQVGFRVIPAK